MLKRNKYLHPEQGCLVIIKKEAKSEYWDKHWQKMQVGYFGEPTAQRYINLTEKYLSKGATILEGGCGLCGKLIALQKAGFRVSGVDYAEDTVARVLTEYPELDVQVGDVRSLPFEDNSLEGYWSFGVIEHFWNGYDEILVEASRVLKPGGYLFLTFPGMSGLRKIKAKIGCYPKWMKSEHADEPDDFYQFILDPDNVCKDLNTHGFDVFEKFQHNIKSGVKQECRFTWYGLRLIDKATPFISKRFIAEASEKLFGRLAGHVSVLVAKKV